MATIEELRRRLDDIDSVLIDVLGERFGVCREIAQIKQQQAIPMMQPGRILLVKQRAAELAARHGIPEEFVDSLYELIIAEACRIEQHIIDTVPS
jgi:chorismate mutase-like protein